MVTASLVSLFDQLGRNGVRRDAVRAKFDLFLITSERFRLDDLSPDVARDDMPVDFHFVQVAVVDLLGSFAALPDDDMTLLGGQLKLAARFDAATALDQPHQVRIRISDIDWSI